MTVDREQDGAPLLEARAAESRVEVVDGKAVEQVDDVDLNTRNSQHLGAAGQSHIDLGSGLRVAVVEHRRAVRSNRSHGPKLARRLPAAEVKIGGGVGLGMPGVIEAGAQGV